MDTTQKILIVDDAPANIKVLTEALKKPDYEILAATCGKQALEIAISEKLDLILLDIIMPEMDGYEVCQKLKANPVTKKIPVMFITARDDEDDETEGLNLGAVDYLTKPISSAIVQARVKTQLTLKHAYEELEKQNIALEETAALREQVEKMTRHDLKTPLNAIIGFSNLLAEELELTPEYQRLLKTIENKGYEMLEMINRSLDLYKMETGTYQYKPVPIDILPMLKRILDETSLLNDNHLSVKLMLEGKPITRTDTFIVQGEQFLCYPMLANLLKNAVDASQKTAIITVSVDIDEEKKARIRIHNQGAVPVEIRDKFFDKLTTAGKSGGTGLGTYSAQLMAKTQGGSIHLDTSEEKGTTVTVCLPTPTCEN